MKNLTGKIKAIKIIHNQLKLSYFKIFYEQCKHIINMNRCFKLNLKNKVININLKSGYFLAKLIQESWEILSFSDKDNLITLRLNKNYNDVIITCRTCIGFDLGHLIEIYDSKVYGDEFKDKIVMDIGMSNGDSSIYFAKLGAKKVIGLEPDKRSFELAVRNIKDSKVDQIVIPLNVALSNFTGETYLIIYDNNPNANSIFDKNMVKLNDNTYRQKVNTISLSELMKINEIIQIDFLKMDCEGCEYDVINSIDSDLFNRIKEIYLEYHNGIQNLPEILSENGFKIEIKHSNENMGYIAAKKITIIN